MTVILAAGDFPKAGGKAWRTLKSAERIVACDSAGDEAKARGFANIITVGDGDSGTVDVQMPDQDSNDLQKAYSFCVLNGWHGDLAIVGATGKREDHTLGNIFFALDRGIKVITDFGVFHPLAPRLNPVMIPVSPGAPVSVFAPYPNTRISSEGLEWPLGGVRLDSLYRATLNRATGNVVTLSTTERAFVYVAYA